MAIEIDRAERDKIDQEAKNQTLKSLKS